MKKNMGIESILFLPRYYLSKAIPSRRDPYLALKSLEFQCSRLFHQITKRTGGTIVSTEKMTLERTIAYWVESFFGSTSPYFMLRIEVRRSSRQASIMSRIRPFQNRADCSFLTHFILLQQGQRMARSTRPRKKKTCKIIDVAFKGMSFDQQPACSKFSLKGSSGLFSKSV